MEGKFVFCHHSGSSSCIQEHAARNFNTKTPTRAQLLNNFWRQRLIPAQCPDVSTQAAFHSSHFNADSANLHTHKLASFELCSGQAMPPSLSVAHVTFADGGIWTKCEEARWQRGGIFCSGGVLCSATPKQRSGANLETASCVLVRQHTLKTHRTFLSRRRCHKWWLFFAFSLSLV